jgi:hypothetical protein
MSFNILNYRAKYYLRGRQFRVPTFTIFIPLCNIYKLLIKPVSCSMKGEATFYIMKIYLLSS